MAAYGFNEGSGFTVADASGNGNTGSASATSWSGAGRFGGALSFNGVSSLVTVNHSATLSLSAGMTLEAWVKASNPANWRTVVMKEGAGGLSYALYGGDDSGRASGYIRRTSDIAATASSALPANTWVHIAATYDGAALRLYTNGTLAASTAVTGSIVTSTSPLRIGGNTAWGEYFQGLIDEVRIYNRALSTPEIQADMTTPVGATVSPTRSISGSISPVASGSGATVSLSGPDTRSVMADLNGNFTFAGVTDGVYTVTASKPGFAMTPTSRQVTVSGADVTGVGFTAVSSPSSPTPIRLIQKATNGSEYSVGTMGVSFPSANTAGDFLIVTGTAARPAGTLTISDTLGNVYVPAVGPLSDAAQEVNIYVWYVANSKGGPNTVTVTPTAARALEIHVSEWSGILGASPVDQTAFAVGSGTLAATPAVSTAAGELVFGYTFIGNNASPGSGFTPLSLVNGDLDEYLIQAAAGTASVTFTQQSGPWNAVLVTFRPVTDTVAPTVAVIAPAAGATVAGSTTLSAGASDNVGVVGVQFQIDGVNVGPELAAGPYSTSWNSTSVSNGPHVIGAVARDAGGNVTAAPPVNVTVNNTAVPSTVGVWDPPLDLGMVAVHMALMHTGKVLMFSGSYVVSDAERVWDPVTGGVTLVPNPYYNLFCAGHTQLADGRILVAGGHDPSTIGAANANIFDPATLSWSALPNMAYRRWYPTTTTLPDGKVLVSSGAQTCLTCFADLPEIFDPATSRFTPMASSARLAIDYYPFMFVLPDGKVLSAGSNESAYETRTLDVKTGIWTMIDPVVKDGHSAVMFRPGKILKTGTAADSGTTGNAASTAYVLDMTQAAPMWRQVASMAFPRAFQNTTILPDGNVLVTGGGTKLDGYDITNGVLAAELWNPTTETWQTLADAKLARLYHSTALLLPDARVLIAGSGDDGPAVNQRMAEIYSPPYLFKGARPDIVSAPDLLQYDSPFAMLTTDANAIASVVLIRPGSVTHGFDEDQRYVELRFTPGEGSLLTVWPPSNANLAPPGYYMMFLVNKAGVPSVAKFVRLPAPTGDTQPPTRPGNLVATGGLGTVALSWTPAVDDTGVALYNVHRSTVTGFVPSVANRVGQVASTSFNQSGLPPGIYYYVVTAQDTTGNVSGASTESMVTVLADTTAPAIALSSPLNQSTVSGSISLSATASDDVGVVGVQFRVDGVNVGAERTALPYSVAWNSASVPNGAHSVMAVARDAAGNQSQVSAAITVSNIAPPASTGLVAAYNFDEASGAQILDRSGTGNAGVAAYTTWSTAGHTGSALSFNGTSSWVTVADAPSLRLTAGMTLEAWVRPSSGTGWRTVLLKEGSTQLSYALYSANSASRPGGWVWTGADYSVTGAAAVSTTAWTHLAVTYDGAALRFFTNGVLVRTRTAVPNMLSTSGALRIGGNSVWGEYFSGLIDDVRLYNRALSAAEVQADMNTPVR